MQHICTETSEMAGQQVAAAAAHDIPAGTLAGQETDKGVGGEIESLLQTLQAENKKKPLRFGVAVATTIVLMILVQAAISHFAHVNVTFIQNMWMVWIGIGAVFAPTRLQKETARRLAQFDDVRAVGPLSEALDQQDRATQAAASSAVTRLLPRVKASDSNLLSSRQRDYLLTGLRKGSRDLKLAVLNALGQIGDERFLKEVTTLSEGRGSAKRDLALRDAGKDCLEPLQHIIESERVRQTLLRPAESVPSAEDSLLRPAGGTDGAGENGSALVRPADWPVSR